MPRNKGNIQNFPNTSDGFADYITQDLIAPPKNNYGFFNPNNASRKPSSLTQEIPKTSSDTNLSAQGLTQFSTSSGGDWGAMDPSKFSLLDKDQQFSDALNTINSMSKNDPSFSQQLQGMSAKDKIGLASSAVTSAAIGAESQTKGQAVASGISAGVSAGLAASSMASMGALASTGVGAVVALGVMAAGLNAAKQAKAKEEDEKKKQEKRAQKAEELRLLESYHNRRAAAMNSLIGAFRRR